MGATAEKQEFTFQAEIQQLLNLLANSLYQSRDITLRELISNASDALDKMRHISLVDAAHKETGPLEIRLEPDTENRQLCICDTGVGMTQEELVQNLGTIAHSGSLEFLKTMAKEAGEKKDVSLIGQFGVGFYSAFMLADRVVVRTRSYQEESGWEWESDGSGKFTISPAESLERGTSIILHLKEENQDFTDEHRLETIVRRYSSFVQHPIKLGEEVINDQKPIWVEPASQVKDEQYLRFYQHLTHHPEQQPLWHLHASFDSPIQFHALLYCPPSNMEQLGFGRLEHGLTLCAKRVLVQNDCRELLPDYMRFLWGLIDSEDLPLNVSRESLQDNTVFRKIRTALVGQILSHLQKLADREEQTYRTFYGQFGTILKEGIPTDFTNRERIACLLRFASSNSNSSNSNEEGVMTSLDEYLERAPDEQKQIFYSTGPYREAIEKNPNLEIFHKRGIEVLYLTDPIDEFVMGDLGKYKDHPLKAIDAEDAEIPESDGEKLEEEGQPDETTPAGLAKVLSLFRTALEDKVLDVRESKRLTDSPCCLVNPEGGMSAQMQRLLKAANQEVPEAKRILEINPNAPLIQQLSKLSSNDQHEGFIKECGRQLHANALLLSGILTDPQEMVDRMQHLLEEAAGGKSPIIH